MPEPTEEKIEVTLEVTARGQVRVYMTRQQYEDTFPEGETVNLNLEEVPGLDWDEMLNALDFEADDAWADDDFKKEATDVPERG